MFVIMADLVQLGKELGYEGQELGVYVIRQKEIKRADRVGDRVAEKGKAEAEKARAEAETEKVRRARGRDARVERG